jgi:hypothetical protein
MFGYVSGGTIRKLALLNVSVTATTPSNSSPGVYAGGVVGYLTNGTVEICCVSGAVSAESNQCSAGGVVGGGVNNGAATVKNCYSTATVKGSTRTGGVVGNLGYSGLGGTIQYCYSTGAVSAGIYAAGVSASFATHCVALNSSITITYQYDYVKRVMIDVVGQYYASKYNYAKPGITMGYNYGRTYTPTSSAGDGDQITATNWNTQDFWTNGANYWNNAPWDFTNIWQWDANANRTRPVFQGFAANAY